MGPYIPWMHRQGAHRSCEHSQSMKLTSTPCTAPLSACGGGAAGASAAAADEETPFAMRPCGAAATALPGRAAKMAVSTRHAFSWVNQSVRCSSLQHTSTQHQAHTPAVSAPLR